MEPIGNRLNTFNEREWPKRWNIGLALNQRGLDYTGGEFLLVEQQHGVSTIHSGTRGIVWALFAMTQHKAKRGN
ncbi:hypothetical protein [Paenibacillus sp. SI8]|uniref:hypothetical protein n=1 Tax=unclassified Paenibacillus TaxID=185978 RepID=UPI0034657B07